MLENGLLSILLLGFTLGIKHSTEPDHIIAVSTIASQTKRLVRSSLSGVFWGLGHTFLLPRGFEIRTPINLPVQRIDYIFHSPEIQVAEVRVVSGDSGSDHRPVWARFDLSP